MYRHARGITIALTIGIILGYIPGKIFWAVEEPRFF
jgi:hypothetical protein